MTDVTQIADDPNTWTDAETWAFGECDKGKSILFGDGPDGPRNPILDADWDASCTLRLSAIESYLSQRASQPNAAPVLRIFGARIIGGYLTRSSVKLELMLDGCRIEGDLLFNDITFSGLELRGCFVTGEVNAWECTSEAGIYLLASGSGKGVQFSNVTARGHVSISGKSLLEDALFPAHFPQLSVRDCVLERDLSIGDLDVGYVFLNGTQAHNCHISDVTAKDLTLDELKCRSLFVNDTTFTSIASFGGVEAATSIWVSMKQSGTAFAQFDKTEQGNPFTHQALFIFQRVRATRDATFYLTSEGQVSTNMIGADFGGRLELNVAAGGVACHGRDMKVAGDATLSFLSHDDLIDLNRAQFGQGLRLLRGNFKSASFRNMTVKGALGLGGWGSNMPVWDTDAVVDFAGCDLGWLDLETRSDLGTAVDAWPGQVNLRGLRIQKFLQSSNEADRLAKSLKRILDRDQSGYAQPYIMCAKLFQDAGETAVANDLLRISKEKQAARHKEKSEHGRRFGIYLQRVFIGYGIGMGYWRIVPWMLGITVIGAIMIHLEQLWTGVEIVPGASGTWLWKFMASLDNLVPVITFDKAFEEAIPAKITHLGLRSWFWLQTLLGWAIGSILGLALAGFTQKGK